MERFSFSDAVMARRQYFKVHGLDEPPVAQDERYKMMRKLNEQEPRNHEAALRLFDEQEDAKNAHFLNSVGFLYGDEKSPFFDDRAALNFFRKSFKYADNADVKSIAANNFLISYFRHFNIAPKEYANLHNDENLVSMITHLAAHDVPAGGFPVNGHVQAKFFAATFHASGKGVERDDEKAVELYRQCVDLDCGYVVPINYSLCLRLVLGLGCERDIGKAKEVLDEFRKKNPTHVLEKFHEIIENFSSALGNPDFERTSKRIVSAQRDNYGPHALTMMAQTAAEKDKKPFVDTLFLLSSLSRWEGWIDAEDWQKAYYTAFSSYVAHPAKNAATLPQRSVHNNTYKNGPFYNAVGANKLPIWGQPDRVFMGSDHDRADQRIPRGWHSLAGVTTDAAKNISFIFNRSVFKPAMIFQEDVDVMLALAFGEEQFQWPSLDLSRTGENLHPYPNMQIKTFEPNWLTITDFGKTFYICDFLSGELAWHIEDFEIADKGDKRLAMLGHALKEMKKNITGDNPKDPNTGQEYPAVINNNPRFVDYTESSGRDGKSLNLYVQKIIMKIDGGFIDEQASKAANVGQVVPVNVDWLYRNDPNFKHTKWTLALTDHFDVVAEVMPVYERLRQLMGMVYVMNHLRNVRGFMPNEKTLEVIRENLSVYKERYAAVGTKTEYIRSTLKPEKGITYG